MAPQHHGSNHDRLCGHDSRLALGRVTREEPVSPDREACPLPVSRAAPGCGSTARPGVDVSWPDRARGHSRLNTPATGPAGCGLPPRPAFFPRRVCCGQEGSSACRLSSVAAGDPRGGGHARQSLGPGGSWASPPLPAAGTGLWAGRTAVPSLAFVPRGRTSLQGRLTRGSHSRQPAFGHRNEPWWLCGTAGASEGLCCPVQAVGTRPALERGLLWLSSMGPQQSPHVQAPALCGSEGWPRAARPGGSRQKPVQWPLPPQAPGDMSDPGTPSLSLSFI